MKTIKLDEWNSKARLPDMMEPSATVQTLRASMRSDGWRILHGDDLCPACVSELKKAAETDAAVHALDPETAA